MEATRAVSWHNNWALHQCWVKLRGGAYKGVYQCGLVTDNSLFSMINGLDFRSDKSYMAHEIAELVYSERRKAPLRPLNTESAKLVAYLRSVGFESENYALAELIEVLFVPDEPWPSLYALGYASTNPVISELIQEVPLKTPLDDLHSIKRRLTDNIQNVANALEKGATFNFMAEMLSKHHNPWIFNMAPLMFGSRKVDNLFLELSHYHNGCISTEMISRLVDFQSILIELAYATDKGIAMEKLFLMIYFPEYVQFIYNSPHPVLVFKAIVVETGKLTEWRHDTVKEINWEGNAIRTIPLYRCVSKFSKSYYDGYRENSMFDGFIQMLKQMRYQIPLKEIFVAGEFPEKLSKPYKRNVCEKEYQGTIYSIINDRYKFGWDPVDPFGEGINPDFENEFIRSLVLRNSPNEIWIGSRYIAAVSGNTIPISRLIFNPIYSMHELAYDYCLDREEARIKAARELDGALANYCQPQIPYQKDWDLNAKNCYICNLFDDIWAYNIKYCDFSKSLETITIELEGDQIDVLTRALLLQILESIVRGHYSSEVASKMNFTVWTDSLKKQLYTIFGELREHDNPKDMRANYGKTLS